MKYVLDGKYETNKNLAEFEMEVKEYIAQSEKKVINKYGVKGFKYDSTFNVKENCILVKISAENVPAHQIFYRIKKELTNMLGRNLKIGVRTVKIDNIEIEFEIEKKVLHNITIPFVKDIKFDENRCKIILENIDETFVIMNYIERIINRIKEKVDKQYYEGKEEFSEILWQSSPKIHAWNKNPTDEMIKLKWVERAPTKGKWFFRPQFVAIHNAMREIAIKELIQPLGFQEVIESNFKSFDVWLKTGHLEGVPNEIYYFAEPKSRDPKLWEEFTDVVYITHKVPIDLLKNLVSEPRGGIVYAQCPNIYWSFKNSVIPLNDLPILIYENTVVSARYESGGRQGIERSDEFHRIEIVFIGTKKQLISLREKMIEKYKHIFNEILDIEWAMSWVTPWYMQHAGLAGVEDIKEKIVGTIDFEAYLPYRGNREDKKSWLEFQNFTIAGNKFTKAFNIKTQTGELWSGCSGIGLERWAIVFLAQKGLDPKEWPDKFKEYLKELPKGFHFLGENNS